jgi:hypothetical protein
MNWIWLAQCIYGDKKLSTITPITYKKDKSDNNTKKTTENFFGSKDAFLKSLVKKENMDDFLK